MKNLKLFGVVLVIYFDVAFGAGLFNIIGPRTVQYKSVYKCVLTGIGFNKNATIKVELIGKSEKTAIDTKEIVVHKEFESVEIEFDLGDEDKIQNYTLSASLEEQIGNKKKVTVITSDIILIPKKYSVFIQTDKPVYNPGDEILYRILVLDSELKPYKVKKLKIEIYDGENNLLPAPNTEVTATTGPPDGGPGGEGSDEETNEAEGSLFGDGSDDEDAENDSDSHDRRKRAVASKEKSNALIHRNDSKIFDGLYSYHFDINEAAFIGDWSIKVIIDDEKDFATTKHFKVKEYILPRFEVIIETKRDVQLADNEILLSIHGNYTFGELVTGEVEVTASVYDPDYEKNILKKATKKANADFHAKFNFNMMNDLNIRNAIKPYMVRFDVIFTEKLTGQRMEKEVKVRVYKTNQYIINIVKRKESFKPGFPYSFAVTVQNLDGLPISSQTQYIRLEVTYLLMAKRCSKVKPEELTGKKVFFRERRPENGRTEFTLDIPDTASSVTLAATYSESKTLVHVKRHEGKSDEHMMLEAKKTDVKVGKSATITAKFSVGATVLRLFVNVFGRSGLVHRERMKVKLVNSTFTFKLQATKEMTPSCRVVCYYVQASGEIIYDLLTLTVEPVTAHKLTLEFKKGKGQKVASVRPGVTCTLGIQTTHNSFVSLLAVDKSVTLMGTDNDINQERISSDLQMYERSTYENDEDLPENYKELAGLNILILTNANTEPLADCKFSERTDGVDETGLEWNEDNFDLRISDLEDEITTEIEPKVRNFFPETWLFNSFKYSTTKQFFAFQTKAPHTISSFIASGFSIHPEHGLVIAKPTTLKVFKEFFLKLYVPKTIRLEEILRVHVSVFNYLSTGNEKIKVTVNMQKNDGFQFHDIVPATCQFTPSDQRATSQQKTFDVPHNNGNSEYFYVKATSPGYITIYVTATSSNHVDVVEKKIKVLVEGIRKDLTQSKIFDMRNKKVDSFLMTLQPNEDIEFVPSSLKLKASIAGDLLGPALENIHGLIKMPHGCPEQTFFSFIPNIAAMWYLNSTGKLTEPDRKRTKEFIAHGYQELLKSMKPNGSFMFWTDLSIWLTAYAVKLQAHIKTLVQIDAKKIVQSLDFLANQEKSGNLQKGGDYATVVHGTAKLDGEALSAYVAIAFLEVKTRNAIADFTEYQKTVDSILNGVRGKISGITHNHIKAMYAYAFSLNKNVNETKNWLKDLHDNRKEIDNKISWEAGSKALKVETAAYAIMAYVNLGDYIDAWPIVNWLMSERLAYGGWSTTTDTVLGIQALSIYAEKVYAKSTHMSVALSENNKNLHTFNLNSANAFKLQKSKLPTSVREISIAVDGTELNENGFAFLQVTKSFNTIVNATNQFVLSAVPQSGNADGVLSLLVCANFIKIAAKSESKMTLVEVQLPSGYEYDDSSSKTLLSQSGVQQVEVLQEKTVVVLYLKQLGSTQKCFTIQAFRKNVVFDLKDPPVKIYEYYEDGPFYASTTYYHPTRNSCK